MYFGINGLDHTFPTGAVKILPMLPLKVRPTCFGSYSTLFWTDNFLKIVQAENVSLQRKILKKTETGSIHLKPLVHLFKKKIRCVVFWNKNPPL